MTHPVTLIEGHWVGPETTAVVQRLIAAVGVVIAAEPLWRASEARSPVSASSAVSTTMLRAKHDAMVEVGRSPGSPRQIILRPRWWAV